MNYRLNKEKKSAYTQPQKKQWGKLFTTLLLLASVAIIGSISALAASQTTISGTLTIPDSVVGDEVKFNIFAESQLPQVGDVPEMARSKVVIEKGQKSVTYAITVPNTGEPFRISFRPYHPQLVEVVYYGKNGELVTADKGSRSFEAGSSDVSGIDATMMIAEHITGKIKIPADVQLNSNTEICVFAMQGNAEIGTGFVELSPGQKEGAFDISLPQGSKDFYMAAFVKVNLDKLEKWNVYRTIGTSTSNDGATSFASIAAFPKGFEFMMLHAGEKPVQPMIEPLIVPEPQPAAAASNEIGVVVKGKALVMDVPPTVVEGRTLAPARAVLESLGWTMEWVAETRTVKASSAGKTIELTIDSKTALVDGKAVTLDVPAQVINGRTLVPLRFIGESTGAAVKWDGESRTVTVE